jgi:formate dehydrogenase subunit gamma
MLMAAEHEWDRETVRRIAISLKDEPGALMPILRQVQDELGWIPGEAVAMIAGILNLSRAEVHGTASFYHDFKHHPPGRCVIQVCRAESCQAVGGAMLADHIRRRLGIGFGETTQDRRFTLEPVYCLGNCACSPAIVVDGELVGRATPEHIDQIITNRNGNHR